MAISFETYRRGGRATYRGGNSSGHKLTHFDPTSTTHMGVPIRPRLTTQSGVPSVAASRHRSAVPSGPVVHSPAVKDSGRSVTLTPGRLLTGFQPLPIPTPRGVQSLGGSPVLGRVSGGSSSLGPPQAFPQGRPIQLSKRPGAVAHRVCLSGGLGLPTPYSGRFSG